MSHMPRFLLGIRMRLPCQTPHPSIIPQRLECSLKKKKGSLHVTAHFTTHQQLPMVLRTKPKPLPMPTALWEVALPLYMFPQLTPQQPLTQDIPE